MLLPGKPSPTRQDLPSSPITLEFHLHTDTATLAIFDTQAIRHRLDDTCDW